MEQQPVAELDDKQLNPVVENDEKTEVVEDTTKKTEEEELNPYKKEMAKLAVENRQKTGALKEEREKSKDLEDRLAALEKAKTEVVEEEEEKPRKRKEDPREIVLEEMRKQRFEDKLVQFSSDKDEQTLIRHHYNNSIVRSGDVEVDLSNAIALANKHLVDQAKRAEVERQGTEALNAKFSSGRSYSKQGGPAYLSDPVKKGAVEILKRLGITDGEKYV